MLLFIYEYCCNLLKGVLFQNIVCYCLSDAPKFISPWLNIFQNIVCYCLSEKTVQLYTDMKDFKTSYVTVYQTKVYSQDLSFLISKHRMLLFIRLSCRLQSISLNFKTSYVTVYRIMGQGTTAIIQFQNIVCYCLSSFGIGDGDLTQRFQNIVCYCLSCT